MLTVGNATIKRIEETCGACYPLKQIFPDITEAQLAERKHWLAPHHYDAAQGLVKLSVHSWFRRNTARPGRGSAPSA